MSTPKVIVAFGLVQIEEAVNRALAASPNDDRIVVGITRYGSAHQACWLVGLSWPGSPVAWVSAHRLKRRPTEQVALVHATARDHDLGDDTTFAALIEQLTARSDQDLPPVPPAVGHD